MNKWTLKEDSTEKFANFNRTWQFSNTSKTYRKELIRVGDYQKGDMKFSVTADTIKHWADTGKEMMENGVKIPVPLDDPKDRHANNPDNNRGWVKNMVAEGNSLFAEIEINAENPDTIAANYDISINVPPSFLDGKGRRYERPITHVALTERPVIPGLQEFQTIAASYFVEADKLVENITDETIKLSDNEVMDYTSIAIELGCDATEDACIAAIKELKGKTQTIAASMPIISAPDQRLVKLTSDTFGNKLDQLVRDCRINPAVATKVKERYLANDVLSLSIQNNNENVLGDILDILKDNEVVSLSVKTGPQNLTVLSEGVDPQAQAKERLSAFAAQGQVGLAK